MTAHNQAGMSRVGFKITLQVISLIGIWSISGLVRQADAWCNVSTFQWGEPDDIQLHVVKKSNNVCTVSVMRVWNSTTCQGPISMSSIYSHSAALCTCNFTTLCNWHAETLSKCIVVPLVVYILAQKD